MFRLLDVPTNHVLGNSTSRPDVVAILPQATSPEVPLFEFRVAFQNRSARVAFELLSNLGRTPFRVGLHEQGERGRWQSPSTQSRDRTARQSPGTTPQVRLELTPTSRVDTSDTTRNDTYTN